MSAELDYARELVASAINAPDHYHTIITLACAVTHRIDDFFSAPRILALGEAGSGKSQVLTVVSYLAAEAGPVTGVLAMTAPSYVADYRMNTHHTPVIDEVNHLFGQAGANGKSSKFYTYLNQGYRRDTAYAQMQENKVPLRIPIFGVAFLAGLGLAAPPDLRERSIIVKMTKANGNASVADFSDPEVRASFEYSRRCLASWARTLPKLSTADVRGLHPKLVHRTMDVWGPLFAVAQAAGDVWVKQLLTAFERVELDAGIPVHAPEVQLVLDYLRYTETSDSDDGVTSGAFAEWANSQDHGAYLGMKPGQFRQFAVSVLGPTAPFYNQATQGMTRGWSDRVHQMNLDNAASLAESLSEAGNAGDSTPEVWEDF